MHNYLHMAPVYISVEKARDAVTNALNILGIKQPQPKDWQNEGIKSRSADGKAQTFLFRDLVLEAQREGFSRQLFTLVDRNDPFFGGTFLMATNSPAFKMKVTYGQYEKELHGPCRFSPLENELTDDILHFRESACAASASNGYYDCTRHYRSFLQSSISLIDCFINRYVQLHSAKIKGPLPDVLTKPATFETRLDAWIQTFTTGVPAAIKQSAEWSQCCMLRQERNRAVHAVEPYVGIQIQDLPRHFNHVRQGIGGLLFRMRELAAQPTLGFIERLRNAPLIEFHKWPNTALEPPGSAPSVLDR
jgi:hypothetical protein